jgi:hypothetical protein
VREHLTAEAWGTHPSAADFPDDDYASFREALGQYQGRRFPGGNFEAALRRLDRSFGHYREQARRLVFTERAAAGFRALQPLLRWLAGGSQDRHLNLLSLFSMLGAAGFAELTARLREPGDAGGAVTGFAADQADHQAGQVDQAEGGSR